MTPLLELADRVEAATGPDRGLDAAICDTTGWWPKDYKRIDVHGRDRRWLDWKGAAGNKLYNHVDAPAYSASLDDAIALVPDGWTFWSVQIKRIGTGSAVAHAEVSRLAGHAEECCEARAATPALALTAAALRARASHTTT